MRKKVKKAHRIYTFMKDTSLSSINRISLTTSPKREQPIIVSNSVRPGPGSRHEKDWNRRKGSMKGGEKREKLKRKRILIRLVKTTNETEHERNYSRNIKFICL